MARRGRADSRRPSRYVEQAKSRTLFDLMFQPVHALAREEGSESQLAHAIRELREELNWYYHLVELEQLRPGDQSDERLSAFQREIGSREKEMARTVRELTLTDAPQSDLLAPSVYSLDTFARRCRPTRRSSSSSPLKTASSCASSIATGSRWRRSR